MTTIPNARIWHPDGWHHGTKFQLDLHGRIEQARNGLLELLTLNELASG